MRPLARRCQTILAILAALGLLRPTVAQANGPAPQPVGRVAASEPMATVVDVALQAGGTLSGVATRSTGQPSAAATVIVSRQGTTIATTRTQQDGTFSVGNLSGGIYEIHCEQGLTVCRCWTPQAAPPAAGSRVFIRDTDGLMRGQSNAIRPYGRWLKGPVPWIVAIATCIAVPAAIVVRMQKSGS